MGRISGGYIFPHPPIIVPEVGKGDERDAMDTINAVIKASKEIANQRPTTIIVTTPHAPVFEDYIFISDNKILKGDFGKFGSRDVGLSFENNLSLVDRIISYAADEGISSGGIEPGEAVKYGVESELDWGALVPLYYITKKYDEFKLVHISISYIGMEQLYRFGMCIRKAVEESDEDVVFVASGDLSHKLANSHYGYSKYGKQFDELVIKSIRENDVHSLLGINEDLCESAAQCGLRSFVIMYGALDGYELKSEVYSYEAPFGIGYGIAKIGVGRKDKDRKVMDKKIEDIRKNEDDYVALARKSLETFVRDGKMIEIPEGLPKEMKTDRAGVFVSIKKDGQLRGCIGTIAPTRESIAGEIIYNAISSGTEDPRFFPVEPNELESLVYSVDVLMKPEPIDSIEELDVVKYGVIVKSGYRSGLLLPNLENVNTPEEQVDIALQKAGIRKNEDYSMQRFEVIRHKA
ncbi:MAG: 2-aminophenol 1,6-dioxygenase subunit beta [Firmicutes bacterium ADurb.Bin419]|nr:MAG: 2-aminophenol 1,6-dioxygenase subunit beta [Firmicutes bacterium ADurb.Bin419]